MLKYLTEQGMITTLKTLSNSTIIFVCLLMTSILLDSVMSGNKLVYGMNITDYMLLIFGVIGTYLFVYSLTSSYYKSNILNNNK